MYRKRFLLSILICLIMAILLSACGPSTNPALPSSEGTSMPLPTNGDGSLPLENSPDRQPIAMGCYVETLIDMQGFDNVLAIAAQGDALYIAAQKNAEPVAYFFRFENDQLYPLAYSLDSEYDLLNMQIGSDGNLILLCSKPTEIRREGRSSSIAAQGGPEATSRMVHIDFTVFALEGDTFAAQFTQQQIDPTLFAALPDGGFLLSDYASLLLVDSGGNQRSQINLEGNAHENSNMVIDGDVMYALTGEEGITSTYSLSCYEFPSGRKITEVPIPFPSISTFETKLSGDGTGGVYMVSKHGIAHLNAGGSKLELLVEGMSYSIGDSSRSNDAASTTANGSVYVVSTDYSDGLRRSNLYCYQWSADTPVYAQTEITIASMYEDPTISEAIAQYMRAHHDVKIMYRTYIPIRHALNIGFYSMDELAQTRTQIDDALRAINTEVLSGNAPDIFVLDSMPIASYVQKGLLDDMSAWAEPRLADGTWMQNIATGYLQPDGTLPCISAKFAVPSLWGDRETINSLTTLDDLVQAALQHSASGYLMDIRDERTLLTTLFPIFAADWTDAQGKVNMSADGLSHFLEQIKALQDALPAPDSKEGSSRTNDSLAAGESDLTMLELGHRGSGEIPHSLLKFSGRQPGVRAMPALSDTCAFLPEMIVGVSAASKHKDIAYDFLDLLLSESYLEDLSYDYGYSVVASVCEKAVRTNALRYGGIEFANVNGNGVTISPLDEAMTSEVLHLLHTADTPVAMDYTLMTMIIEECTPYLRGEKSLDSVVQSLYGRTKAYLAE